MALDVETGDGDVTGVASVAGNGVSFSSWTTVEGPSFKGTDSKVASETTVTGAWLVVDV